MQEDHAPLALVPAVAPRTTRPLPRVTAPDNPEAGRRWVIGPRADVDAFLCQVAAVCEASGPGGGPPDILWLREIAKVYGLVPVDP